MSHPLIRIVPLTGLPEVVPGHDLAQHIIEATRRHELPIGEGDIFVVAQKVVSKAEGRIVPLDSITPSERALRWAADYHKDPRVTELVLREATRIVRMERGVIIAETRHGFICANAGVDVSNSPQETAILLPADPDRSALDLQRRLKTEFGTHVAIIISDTFGRPWREGLVNVALGVAGIAPLIDYRGTVDASGKKLEATVIAVADEIASAAELVMGKSHGVPVVIVQGVVARKADGNARDLIRPAGKDLFR